MRLLDCLSLVACLVTIVYTFRTGIMRRARMLSGAGRRPRVSLYSSTMEETNAKFLRQVGKEGGVCEGKRVLCVCAGVLLCLWCTVHAPELGRALVDALVD